LCAAIRAGWREGYSAGIHVVVGAEHARPLQETIRDAAGFTRFSTDTSRLFESGSDMVDRAWMLAEFVRPFEIGDAVYEFTPADALRLASKFGLALKTNEQLHESIRQARTGLKTGRSFEFEPSLEGASTVTTPHELIFWLHWLKARGHAAQLAAPNIGGGVPERLKDFAAIARHYQCTLSISSGAGHTREELETIARATIGRVNYKLSPELRLPPEHPEYSRYIVWLAEHLLV
jgi:hypothetical protein